MEWISVDDELPPRYKTGSLISTYVLAIDSFSSCYIAEFHFDSQDWFSEEGCVEPIIKMRVPLTDSSKEGWNSPSLYFEKLTFPTGVPNFSAIEFASTLLCVQAKIFAGVFMR